MTAPWNRACAWPIGYNHYHLYRERIERAAWLRQHTTNMETRWRAHWLVRLFEVRMKLMMEPYYANQQAEWEAYQDALRNATAHRDDRREKPRDEPDRRQEQLGGWCDRRGGPTLV